MTDSFKTHHIFYFQWQDFIINIFLNARTPCVWIRFVLWKRHRYYYFEWLRCDWSTNKLTSFFVYKRNETPFPLSHFSISRQFLLRDTHINRMERCIIIYQNVLIKSHAMHSASKQMSHTHTKAKKRKKLLAIDRLKCVAFLNLRSRRCGELTHKWKMYFFTFIKLFGGVLSSPIHFGMASTICMIGNYQFISEAIFSAFFPSISTLFLSAYCSQYASYRWHDLMASQIKRNLFFRYSFWYSIYNIHLHSIRLTVVTIESINTKWKEQTQWW